MSKLSRRPFIKKLAGATAATGLLASQTACASGPVETKGDFVHMVFFWLKPDKPDDDQISYREAFLNFLIEFIDQIDFIKEKHIGVPGGTFAREVVDASYHFSLVVTFRNKAEHDEYQEHPAHKEFIENTNYLLDRVQVYDSIRLTDVERDAR